MPGGEGQVLGLNRPVSALGRVDWPRKAAAGARGSVGEAGESAEPSRS